jgi:hypothetical protein
MSKAGKPGQAAINMGLPALTIASAAGGAARHAGSRMTADRRWCPVPGLVGEACLLQLPDAGRDEPEAVLPGGFVVEAVWQIGRGSGPQPL